jgi:CBS domain-containing protein
MSALPNLKTAMTPFPYTVARDASLAEAREMMAEHGIRHLPVTVDHELMGVVSERDLQAALSLTKASAAALTVGDICATDVYVVDLEEPIENVLLTMAERHIGSAIVTRRGRLAGIFTAVDACRAFGGYIRDTFPRPDGDSAA